MGIIVVLASLISLHSILPVLGSCVQPQKVPAPSANVLPKGVRHGGPAGLDAARSPFQTKFIGESGGYTQLPPDASDAMETGAQQSGASAAGSVPQVVDRPGLHPKPISGPSARPTTPPSLHPALTRPRPVVARPQAETSPVETAVPQEADRRRYSLWEGLAVPMELSGQKVGDVSEDEAATLGRKDYDTHILGQRDTGAPQPALRAPGAVAAGYWSGRPLLSGAVGAEPSGGQAAPEVFVTLNLDLKKHPDATLKDAVADLGRIAGFRQDMRFEPAAVGAGPDQVVLWGWMHPGRVGAALQVPSVVRLEVNAAARRSAPETATDMLMGVRVPRDSGVAEAVARLERDLAASGLRVRRTIGTQTAPGTAETVLVVEASVPLSLLPRLMAHPDVVKMMPAPQAPAAAPRRRRPIAAQLRGFLAFAADQSPLLLVLTLLMLLPWVGSGVAAAVRVFVPYR